MTIKEVKDVLNTLPENIEVEIYVEAYSVQSSGDIKVEAIVLLRNEQDNSSRVYLTNDLDGLATFLIDEGEFDDFEQFVTSFVILTENDFEYDDYKDLIDPYAYYEDDLK